MTPDEWKAHVQQWQQRGGQESSKAFDPKADPPADDTPSGGGEGWMGSIGAGLKGAQREFTGDATEDPNHSTAEWVGRQAADWGPLVALDAFGPEVPMAGVALKYAPRLASLAQKGLTGAYKGAIGGEWMQPKNRTQGGMTGAATGAAGGATRAGFNMLPPWAKFGAMAAIPNIAGLFNVAHEMSGSRGGYVSPWSLHHALSALGALAAAVAGMPGTAGGAASKIQDTLDPEQQQ